MLSTFVFYFIFAFIANSPMEILRGLVAIYKAPSLLVEDYIEVGSVGAALMNSALVGIFGCLVMKWLKSDWGALNVMSLWLACGFSFFGKNLLNIMPIVVGGVLYCWFQKIKVADNFKFILLSTTLAPVVSQMQLVDVPGWISGEILGVVIGLVIGFIAIPISGAVSEAFHGYNLYGMGFAGGIIGIVLSSILRNFGVDLGLQSIWSEGNNTFFTIFLVILFVYVILMGFFVSPCSWKEYFNWEFFVVKDAMVHDSFHIKGEQSYQNMGTLGLAALALVLLTGAQISGPLIGGIFTIVGFGSKGKTLANMTPIVVGCAIGALSIGLSLSDSTVLLALLFSTTLSPIANRFGLFWGIIAGFLHFHTVSRLGEVHGGINLYNNGLAGGLIVIVLVPVILALRSSPRVKRLKKYHRNGPRFMKEEPSEEEETLG